MSNDPDLAKREAALKIITEVAKFEKSIDQFRRIDNFLELLTGAGCRDVTQLITDHFSAISMKWPKFCKSVEKN